MEKLTALAVLGGALTQNGNGDWHTTEGDAGDHFGVTNDRWRVLAATALWQADPNLLIVASGGHGQYAGQANMPTLARVIRDELVELGVDPNSIITEEASGNSYEQLLALARLVSETDLEEVRIISNWWHLPRLEAMAEYAPGLKGRFETCRFKWLAAEDVLINHKPTVWQAKVAEDRASAAIQDRWEKEQQGVAQIKNGTYKFS